MMGKGCCVDSLPVVCVNVSGGLQIEHLRRKSKRTKGYKFFNCSNVIE